MLRTLGKTTWEEIKVGEVFAYKGCWEILVKISKNRAMTLSKDHGHDFSGWDWHMQSLGNSFYKLPLSVQRLWKTD